MRVLDVGGDSGFWRLAAGAGFPLPALTIVNLRPEAQPLAGVRWVLADARALPFRDREFDLAFSNSVIEHLADPFSQCFFAAEVQRVARRHFVQTPNRLFPVEPHLIAPCIHWLPRRWARRLIRHGTVWGLVARPTRGQCDDFLDATRLLDAGEMRCLFPRSEIVRERVCGWTKSLIATGRAS
jgi:hypothetical protein